MSFWSFRSSDVNHEDGVLQIDGVLSVDGGWWDDGIVIARDIRKAIAGAKDLTVYINSPGGDVMAGSEIYTALREHSEQGKGKVTVKISGIAASAASVIAMAGDEILMSPTAYMMIHDPWTNMSGNSHDLRKEARVLDEIAEGIINAYQRKTGKPRDRIEALMQAETYMSAKTAVDEGFADGILYAPPQDLEGGTTKPVSALMQAKNYGRQAVMAQIRQHRAEGADETEHVPDNEKEKALRDEIANRAAIIAALF